MCLTNLVINIECIDTMVISPTMVRVKVIQKELHVALFKLQVYINYCPVGIFICTITSKTHHLGHATFTVAALLQNTHEVSSCWALKFIRIHLEVFMVYYPLYIENRLLCIYFRKTMYGYSGSIAKSWCSLQNIFNHFYHKIIMLQLLLLLKTFDVYHVEICLSQLKCMVHHWQPNSSAPNRMAVVINRLLIPNNSKYPVVVIVNVFGYWY